MAEQEARELFPVTFFNGEGPVVMGGVDFRPKTEFVNPGADNPDESAQEPEGESADNLSATEQSTTAPEMAEKRKAAAPD